MDYTKFLNKKEHVVAAYLGGAHVFGKDRRLRVEGERPALGFHRFEVRGRNARSLEAVELSDVPELSALPKARGHLIAGWLVSQSGAATALDRVALLPDDEPAPFAIARARAVGIPESSSSSRVESKNCLSQAFVKPSVGKNKAEALKLQLSNFWGIKAESFGVRIIGADNVDTLCGAADRSRSPGRTVHARRGVEGRRRRSRARFRTS